MTHCTHKTIDDHTRLGTARGESVRFWRCSTCLCESRWTDQHTYHGNVECKRCQATRINRVACSDKCRDGVSVSEALDAPKARRSKRGDAHASASRQIAKRHAKALRLRDKIANLENELYALEAALVHGESLYSDVERLSAATVARLEAENAALRKRVAKAAGEVRAAYVTYDGCKLCGATWDEEADVEVHAPDCIAAPVSK